MTMQLVRRCFTVEQYHQMIVAGIFPEDDRIELIHGEIVEMSPVGRRHAACVKRLNQLFSQILGIQAIVAVQDPIKLGDRSEPQPDIALLKPRPDFYAAGHPQPEDILLLVEVADTSMATDREVKIPLYASSSILEVWLVDIDQQSVEVYSQPAANIYQEFRILHRGESLIITAFAASITVDDVFGSN
jgi:Uma2 family endonuclease